MAAGLHGLVFFFIAFLLLRRKMTVAGRERQRDHDWLVHKPGDAKTHDHEAPNKAIGTQRGVVSRSITVGSGGIGLWLGGTGALRPTSETSNQVAHLVPICPLTSH